MTFKKLGEDVLLIKDYLESAEVQFCDLSVGVKYMWRDEYVIDYAIEDGTLFLRENNPQLKDGFYYPMGKDALGGLKAIETYCKKARIPLCFCYLDESKVEKLKEKYPIIQTGFNREWSDYIYDA